MKIAFASLILAVAGCKHSPDLQPFVAAAGAYAVMAAEKPAPSPAPPTDGCKAGCKCNGTGVEPTGDGHEDTPCRCPDDCKCKPKMIKAATTCTTGTCGWPPKNIKR